jgi:uncharacterized protein YdeI (YjbR/CyaY-like superfamily)
MNGSYEKPLVFLTSKEWNGWLAENGSSAPEGWLVIKKKKAEIPGMIYDEALDIALCFGWIDGKMRSRDQNTFFQRFSPRRKSSPWSLINRRKAESLIERGSMTEAGLEKIEEAKQNGRWQSAYTSKKVPEVPEELIAALKKDPEAFVNFSAFSNSVKLMYSSWIVDAKRPDTRSRRIRTVVHRSKNNQKPGIDLRIIE